MSDVKKNQESEMDIKTVNEDSSAVGDAAKKLGVDTKHIIAAIASLGNANQASNNL
jgi:hypothetical protein